MSDPARTMVLSRVIAAPLKDVWQAWSDPAALPVWWGPEGFSCRTDRIDLREGGEWVFDMIAPDGTVFANRHRFTTYRREALIVYELDDPTQDRPHATATISFAAEGSGTRVTLSMEFATIEEYETARTYQAEAMGHQTLGKLAAFVGG